jgi:hypothetical protein
VLGDAAAVRDGIAVAVGRDVRVSSAGAAPRAVSKADPTLADMLGAEEARLATPPVRLRCLIAVRASRLQACLEWPPRPAACPAPLLGIVALVACGLLCLAFACVRGKLHRCAALN